MTIKQRTLSLAFLVSGISLSLAVAYALVRQPSLNRVPFVDSHLEFSVRPPAKWIFLSPTAASGAPASKLEGLRVSNGASQLHLHEAGLRAIFAEPHRQSPRHQFRATITIAAHHLPDTLDLSRQNITVAYAQSMFSSSALTLKPSQNIRPVTIHGLRGAQTDYEYAQADGNSIHNLSTRAVVLLSDKHRQAFLLTITAPTERFAGYRFLFRQVVNSFKDTVGNHST